MIELNDGIFKKNRLTFTRDFQELIQNCLGNDNTVFTILFFIVFVRTMARSKGYYSGNTTMYVRTDMTAVISV